MDLPASEDASAARLSLAKAVSMSGAFPGAFPAETFTLVARGMAPMPVDMLLADGGIYDNLGYRLMASARDAARREKRQPLALYGDGWDKRWDVDFILVSNGGQMFDLEAASGTGHELGRVIGLLSDLPGSRQEEVFRERWVSSSESNAPSDTIFFSPGLITGSPDDWLSGLNYETGKRQNADYRLHDSLCNALLGLNIGFFPLVAADLDRWSADQILELCPDREGLRKAIEAFHHPPPLQEKTPPSKPKNNRERYESLFEIPPAELQQRDLASKVADVIVADIEDCVKSFRKMGTLQDQVNPADAWRIHRLGRYLVLFKWADLQQRIPAARERREKLDSEQEKSQEYEHKLLRKLSPFEQTESKPGIENRE
jgi:hypothetical protein